VDLTLWLKAAIMGVVEGLTEFLPISSTGHLILTPRCSTSPASKIKVFEIAIQTARCSPWSGSTARQLGAAVAGIARSARSRSASRATLLIAFLPAVVLGLALRRADQGHLFSPCRSRWPSSPARWSSCGSRSVTIAAYGERDLQGRGTARVETSTT
jgi:undecaprenyl-diphosphatase